MTVAAYFEMLCPLLYHLRSWVPLTLSEGGQSAAGCPVEGRAATSMDSWVGHCGDSTRKRAKSLHISGVFVNLPPWVFLGNNKPPYCTLWPALPSPDPAFRGPASPLSSASGPCSPHNSPAPVADGEAWEGVDDARPEHSGAS